jgi:hypothetical protein
MGSLTDDQRSYLEQAGIDVVDYDPDVNVLLTKDALKETAADDEMAESLRTAYNRVGEEPGGHVVLIEPDQESIELLSELLGDSFSMFSDYENQLLFYGEALNPNDNGHSIVYAQQDSARITYETPWGGDPEEGAVISDPTLSISRPKRIRPALPVPARSR